MRQILWGLFKKIVIADNLGYYVNDIYRRYAALDGIGTGLGTVYFAFQIYCDFSGYSDIAIGSARLFGFKLTRNFAYPYFSRDIAEFWRRWHISLSTWFRDYLYVPLGGNRGGRGRWLRNILVTFTISGLWHVERIGLYCLGLLHGSVLCAPDLHAVPSTPYRYGSRRRVLPTVRKVSRSPRRLAWCWWHGSFFGPLPWTRRSAFLFICGPTTGWCTPGIKGAIYVVVLVLIEWRQRARPHGLAIAHWPRMVRWAVYYSLIAGIFWYGNTAYSPFIYFQF